MALLNWFGRILFGLAGIAACWGVWFVVYRDAVLRSSVTVEKPAPPALSVEVVPVHREMIEERIVLVGSLEPVTQTEVRSRVSGYIQSLPVDVGDFVHRGDVLCQLDTETQEEAVASAQAALKVAQAQLQSKKTELALATKTVERQQSLEKSGAGTAQQLESALAQQQIAEAGIDLEEAHVAQAEAELLQAELGLKDLKLTAPIDGYVAERLANVGNLTQPDAAILKIVQLDVVQTAVQVVEKDYSKIQIGQQANVRVDSFPDHIFNAEVKRISPVLNLTTRTATVDLEVSNTNHLLKPGMFARVSLQSRERREGDLVPASTILNAEDRPTIMVLPKGGIQVEARPVDLGIVAKDVVEIRGGLKPGDLAITLGNRLVHAGQEVRAIQRDWSSEMLADTVPKASAVSTTPGGPETIAE